ncbi:ribosome silencing factor [Helicobacter cetorum]|uniref:ribosome silencing factor n=1 Tax=Helicobacter cetorum TaxID=138563 RepID=UPI000CF06905|nr:ribosome silencing factor [Helicobacter cetorum]
MNKRIETIMALLDEKKAFDITHIDLSKTPYLVEDVIIATALASKHALSLLDTLKNTLKPLGEIFYQVDESSEEWIIIDLGDLMVHLFTEDCRKKFDLEGFLNTYKSEQNHQNA